MKLLNLKNKRKATKDDFKLGTTLFDSEGNSFTLKNEYAEGIWESVYRVHFTSEAKHYWVVE